MPRGISEAKKRIKTKKEFYNNLGSYVATSIFLIGVNIFTSPGYMWAWWPIGFWGISLVSQALKIFVNEKTSKWERKALRDEIESMGYDPDSIDYEELDLEDTRQKAKRARPLYRDSDLV